MKNIVALVLGLVLVTSPAMAGDWAWRNLGSGYYTRVNVAGTNDGWYYRQNASVSYKCGYPYTSYSYSKYARIETYYPSNATAGVTYSANWKADLIKALDKAKDNELFIQAVRESGLAVNGGGRLGIPDVGAYVSSGAYGNGYARGTSTYYQGFQAPYADQGNTVYGLASYAPGIGQVDIEGLLQLQARIVERLADNTSQSNYAFSDRVQQISSSQLELAKIREAGNVLVETLKASSPPKQVTNTWETGTEAGSGLDPSVENDDSRPLESSSGSGGRGDAYMGSRTSPGTSGGGDALSALSLVRVQAYFEQNCTKCHGETNPKKNLSLAHINRWKRDQFDKYGPLIIKRMSSEDPKVQMPPPDSGGTPPNAEESRAIVAIFNRKEREL